MIPSTPDLPPISGHPSVGPDRPVSAADFPSANATAAASDLPAPAMMALDDIRPYWRNPRQITEDAVNALAESISRYGYQQPIVVDGDHTIVVGHTRYAALRRLGITHAPVTVATGLSAEQAKQFRLVDNKVGEFTSWDFEALADEIGGLDQDLMRAFFPEVTGSPDEFMLDFSNADLPWESGGQPDNDAPASVELICPHCFHSWMTEVTRDQLLHGGNLT